MLFPAATGQSLPQLGRSLAALAIANVPAALGRALNAAARWGDIQLGAYLGANHTPPSDIHIRQPNGTDLTLHGVRWRGEPLKRPPYYGYRGTVWPGNRAFGVMLDFTHMKAEAFENQTVRLSGRLDGKPAPDEETVSELFHKLEFTHGYNLLTLNALYRRAASAGGRVVPYIGAGAGVSIPHVEMFRAGWANETRTDEYQIAGPAFQFLAGVEWRISPRLSWFLEYKLSCTLNTGRLVGGGTLKTNLCGHQVLSGPAAHLIPRR